MNSLSFGVIFLFALVMFGVIAMVLVAVVFARGRNTSGMPRPMAVPSPTPNREARLQILQQLADQRISVEEAETRLAAMGNPVPTTFQPTTAQSTTSSGVGCLIAVLAVMALMGLLVLALVAWMFLGYREAAYVGQKAEAERLHAIHQIVDSESEVAVPPEAEVTEETMEEWEEDTQ